MTVPSRIRVDHGSVELAESFAQVIVEFMDTFRHGKGSYGIGERSRHIMDGLPIIASWFLGFPARSSCQSLTVFSECTAEKVRG